MSDYGSTAVVSNLANAERRQRAPTADIWPVIGRSRKRTLVQAVAGGLLLGWNEVVIDEATGA